jgi:SET domain-containing protein
MQQTLPSLFVGPSSRGGRGVFTSAPIPKGSIIEISPVIVMPGQERSQIDQTKLHDYYFIWGDEDDQCAIVLGYGSLYNHAYQPNAEYAPDFERQTLDFYALRDIQAGEEITVNYSGDPEGEIELWFDMKSGR